MSNTKHTPGPWSYSDHASPRITNVECDIARVEALPGSENHSEVRGEVIANARLIAAAPDLLAALRDAEATIAVLQPHNRYPDGSIKQGPSELLVRIRAAIAKAEQS